MFDKMFEYVLFFISLPNALPQYVFEEEDTIEFVLWQCVMSHHMEH